MPGQIDKYITKLIMDRSAVPGGIGFAVKDDRLLILGAPPLTRLAGDIISE